MFPLVMIPLTSMTAILFGESLSSLTTSSSRGPEDALEEPLRPPRRALPAILTRLNKKEMPSRTRRMIAKIIQPCPRLGGRGAAGAVNTGGGVIGGGGGGGLTGGMF